MSFFTKKHVFDLIYRPFAAGLFAAFLAATGCKSTENAASSEPAPIVQAPKTKGSSQLSVHQQLGWQNSYIGPVSKNVVRLQPHLAPFEGLMVIGNHQEQLILNPDSTQPMIAAAFLNAAKKKDVHSWSAAKPSIGDGLTAQSELHWGLSENNQAQFASFNGREAGHGELGLDDVGFEPTSPFKLTGDQNGIFVFSSDGNPEKIVFTKTEQVRQYQAEAPAPRFDAIVSQKLSTQQKSKWQVFRTAFSEATPESFSVFRKYAAKRALDLNLNDAELMLSVNAEDLFSDSISH